jgi:ammonia channel protein AmtB
MGTEGFFKRRSLKADDSRRTAAAELTLRQSIFPICLVTVLFFLWGFSYGLLDTLNKHFQNVLNINQARSSGLQAAYFGYVSPVSEESRKPPTGKCSLNIFTTTAKANQSLSAHIRLLPSAMPPGSFAIMAIALSSFGASAYTPWVRFLPLPR